MASLIGLPFGLGYLAFGGFFALGCAILASDVALSQSAELDLTLLNLPLTRAPWDCPVWLAPFSLPGPLVLPSPSSPSSPNIEWRAWSESFVTTLGATVFTAFWVCPVVWAI